MKGKIDKNGVLHIQRGKEMLPMECIGSTEDKVKYCSHKCCQFCEPELRENENWEDVNGKPEWVKDGTTFVDLEICDRKNLIFDELIDEREKE